MMDLKQLSKKALWVLIFGCALTLIIYWLNISAVNNLIGNSLGQIGKGPSQKTFTLQGEIPNNFKLDILSYYQKDRADECLRYDFAERETRSYSTGIKKTIELSNKDTYQVKIPVSYYDQGCHLPIQAIKIIAYEYYDVDLKEESMEQSAASLSFVDSAQLEEKVPHFDQNNPYSYNSRCTNALRIMGGDLLVKLLGCYYVDEDWQWIPNNSSPKVYNVLRRNELENQLITINFRQNPKDDYPYLSDTWEKTEKGLKPCYGKGEGDPFGFCHHAPGKYRTFIMEGKTCTIYPNCKE